MHNFNKPPNFRFSKIRLSASRREKICIMAAQQIQRANNNNNRGNGAVPCELHNFYKSTENSDVILLVEDKELFVNKMYLSMWSPVFKSMFFGEFRERNEDRILLPGKLTKDIEEMLQCIYPSQKPVCDETCDTLLRLAREYQITALTSRCEDFLLRFTGRRPLDKLLTAQEYRLMNLYHASLEDIAKNPLFHMFDRNQQSNSRLPSTRLVELSQATKVALFDKMIEYGYRCFRADL